MKKINVLILFLAIIVTLESHAQPFTTFASGFSNLIGISRDVNGNLFVAESGSGLNDSRISLIDQAGMVYPVVIDLPSYFDTASGETSGAWRADMISSNQLMVVVGGGPDTNAGSIMFFDMSSFIPGTSIPFMVSDADSIFNFSDWVYGNGFTDSNPYSAVVDANGDIVVADAGANAIIKYSPATQTYSILSTFPQFTNPFGGNPPMIDYVPTKIVMDPSGGFYLCNLGGFFPTLGRISSVDANGLVTIIDSGMTALVDLHYDALTGDKYVLEFGSFDSLFHPIPGSAKMYRIDSNGSVSVADSAFGPSAGFVLDGNGGAYYTEIATGNVIHSSDVTAIKEIRSKSLFEISASPNPFTTSLTISLKSKMSEKANVTIKNVAGKTVYQTGILLSPGENKFEWNGENTTGTALPGGHYFINVNSSLANGTIKLLKQ